VALQSAGALAPSRPLYVIGKGPTRLAVVQPVNPVVQMPALQTWPEAQTLPQPPQLLVSVAKFLQVPLHMTLGALQADVATQVPALQVRPEPQTLPQPPQLLASFMV
jgi:hypothetical protein